PPTSQNFTSVIDADVTQRLVQPLKNTCGSLPQGFFDDAQDHIHSSSTHPPAISSATSPSLESRPAFFTRLFSPLLRSHGSVHETTVYNRPSSFTPFNWIRALFPEQPQPDVESEQCQSKIDVPCTRGLPRIAKVRRKSEKKAPISNNVMTININVADTSPPRVVQQSGGVTQQSSSQLATTPTADTSAMQQSSGASHTQQSMQPQVLLAATPDAAIATTISTTTSIVGTLLHPDIVIRQPGPWTRFRLFLCCVSAEIADNPN
ncbi:hypothetical protein AZE42_08220, partial [Rhizopogon vesiculosus]